MLKRVVAVGAGATALPGLLAACAPAGPTSKPADNGATKQEAKPKTLQALYVGVEANVDSIRYAANKYKQQEGIDVNIDSFPQTAMREKLFAELGARSSHYDVVLIDHPWGPATAPHLLDLRAFIDNPNVTDPKVLAADDIIPQTWAQVAFDQAKPWFPPMEFQLPDYIWKGPVDFTKWGQTNFAVTGIPFHPNVLVMAYRLDYFENPQIQAKFKSQYGRDLAPPEDWDQFLDVAKFFTKSQNPDSPTDFGSTLMAKKHESLYTDWRTWNRTFGVVEINEKMEPNLNNADAVRATTFYADLINKHQVVPKGALTWTWDEVTTAWGSGQTAIGMNYHRMKLDPKIEASGGKAGFTLVPGQRQPDGSVLRAPHYGTYFLAVNKYSKNPRWAYDFVLNASSPDWQREYGKFLFHSSRLSYYKDPEVQKTRPEYWPAFSEGLKIGYARPRIGVYVEYSETIQAEVSRYLLGEQDLSTAFGNATKNIREIFTREHYFDQLNG